MEALSHKFENVISRGKAYRDYCWKRDFGDEENITWDKYFSKRGKNVLICKDCDITFKHPALKKRHFESVHYQKKYESP